MQNPEQHDGRVQQAVPAGIGAYGHSMWRRGRKPYGYRAEEAQTVHRMLELRARGFGFDRIAEILNQEELPSRDGKLWHGLVVNRILCRLQNAPIAERADCKNPACRRKG